MCVTVMRRVLAAGIMMAVLACGASAEAALYYAGWTVGDRWNGDGPGTILRSTDSGNTWTRQGAGQIADVNMAGVVAVDPHTAWVVGDSDRRPGNPTPYATIYHTTDGGTTWERKGSSVDVPDVDLAKVTAYGDSKVWAVGNTDVPTTSAIMHTSDGGATWTNQIPAEYDDVGLQCVHTPDGTNVWVTGDHKDGYALILKSTDAGQTWTRQSGGDVSNPDRPVDHLLGVSAVDAKTAWAMGAYPVDGGMITHVVLHTADGGETWWNQYEGAQDGNEVCAVNASTVWAVSDNTIIRSTDGGLNWDVFSSSDYTMGISAVSSQEAWAVRFGLSGTIYHTADGGSTWVQLHELGGEGLPGLFTVSFSTQPIPEPSTLALCLGLLATGAIWLGLRRRK